MIATLLLGAWMSLLMVLICVGAERVSLWYESLSLWRVRQLTEDVNVMDNMDDLFAAANVRDQPIAFAIPASTTRLWREELPSLVWQVSALMSGEREPRDDVETQFLAYHRDNAHVYVLFDKYTRYAIDRGRRVYSHWNVMQRLRWDIEMQAVDAHSEFKIANDYIALYARWWMERNPNWLDFFETKFRMVEEVIIERLGRIPEGRAEGMARRQGKEAA